MRDKRVLVPDSDTIVEPHDRLMLVQGPGGWEQVGANLEAVYRVLAPEKRPR